MVRVEIIHRLDLYEPTAHVAKINKRRVLQHSEPLPKFGVRPSEVFDHDAFYHFPIVVAEDGSPWEEANRFLMNRLTGVLPAKHRTLESLAGDLRHFRQWLVDEGVDFLQIPMRARARPTYRYCRYLHDEIQRQNIKPGTAKRRMSSVQNFYRWLSVDGYEFDQPLWLESEVNMMFKDRHGFQRQKAVKSTDLTRSFKAAKNSDEYGEYIQDGCKLRPLQKEEQIAVVESLRRVGNIEMLLAFLLALTTGARLQTVFTLRFQHFEAPLREGLTSHRLKVGYGTLIDTKRGKQMVILIPAWLCQRIRLYLHSERYQQRVLKSKHVYKSDGQQYAFLTKTGQPYYMAHDDEFAYLYRSPPRGNAVTQFIRQQLRPELLRNSHS